MGNSTKPKHNLTKSANVGAGKSKPTISTDNEPRVVLLVPFSSEDPSRNQIWGHVHSWLKQTLDYPMYIGEHFPETPITYNLSLARNQAGHKAGDWDVAVIHDADTVINPQQIKDGVALALETGSVVYPYVERWELDFNGTKMLLQDETSDWQKHMTQYTHTQPLGGCIIVRRDLWDLVRGFDSGFVGWGHEDGAFAMACEVLSGKRLQRIPGKSLHLEHILAPAKKPDNPVYLANQARIKTYMHSTRQPNARELIRKLRDGSIKTDQQHGTPWPLIKDNKEGMNQAFALMLLTDVTNVLDKYKCTHWLSDGTLLGAIRENSFIPHDEDIDLGIWAEDFDIRVIHELINRYGCHILRLQGKPDDGMIITVGRVGIHLDMFFYYPVKKTKKKSSDKIYSCLYTLFKPYNTSNRAKQFDCELPSYKPLVRHDFEGHKFWVPKNAEKHLVAIYGPDWRKPKKNWTFENDQCNMKLRGTVEDMTSDKESLAKYLRLKLLNK